MEESDSEKEHEELLESEEEWKVMLDLDLERHSKW